MTSFILGYKDPESSELTLFNSKQDAAYNSEEWCEVFAETFEEAKANYEEHFLAWQNKHK